MEYKARWFILSSSLITAASSGTAYAFGIYSEKMKELLHYTQHDIDVTASVGDIGVFLGFVAGFFYSVFGPRCTLMLGFLLSSTGFFLLYLFVSGVLSSSVSLVAFASLLSSSGNSFRTTAACAVVIRNFPDKDRGKVVGLVKGFFAIGASFYSQSYIMFFDPSVHLFFLYISVFILFSSCSSVPFFKILPENPNEEYNFACWFVLTIFFAAYLLGTSIINTGFAFGPWMKWMFGLILFCILLIIFIFPYFVRGNMPNHLKLIEMVDLKEFDDVSLLRSPSLENDEEVKIKDENEAETDDAESVDNLIVAEIDDNSSDARRNKRVWQSVRTLEFYLLLVIFFCCSGSGLIVINNIAQIQYSLTKTVDNNLNVCLIGVSNLSGRLTWGYLSDRFHSYFSRPIFLFLCLCGMSFANIILSFSHPGLLIPCVALVGFSYGCCFVTVPSLAADIFGSKYFAENYGALDLAPAAGALFYASYITNLFYVDVRNKNGEVEDCFGRKCFQNSFYVASISCTISALLCVILRNRLKNTV